MRSDVLPFASIIVVNYNGMQFLTECFDALAHLAYPRDRFEVILVDNASTDDSVGYTRLNFPWIRILQLDNFVGRTMRE